MRIGVCTQVSNAALVKSIGYDFIETSLNGLEQMSEEEFSTSLETLNKANIQVEAVNCFYPGNMEILNKAKFGEIRAYCAKALTRASLMGAKIAVMGSGGARKRPENISQEEYEKTLFSLLNLMGEEAEKVGMIIAIEPLNRMETNEINLLSECIEVVKKVSLPSVKALADVYQMHMVNEGIQAIEHTDGLLAHVHLARRNADRGVPCAEDQADLQLLSSTLKKVGYTGRVSIEAVYHDFEKEIKAIFPLLKVFK